MIKNYFSLIVLTVMLSFTQTFSQSCPPIGFSDGDSLFFYYDSGTSLCVDRPTVVYVDGSEFTMIDCDNLSSVYDLTSGAPISNINMFTVDFGFGTCEYTNGNLSNETLSTDSFSDVDRNSIRIFPNPVGSGDHVFIDFGNVNVNVDITIYSITGKQILNNNVSNLNTVALNISGVSNGVYLMKISSKTTSITRKFVVMK